MALRLLFATVVGLALGAAFGVAFGLLASVFEGGPTAAVGIAESWWWFSLVGAAIGAGAARAAALDPQPR